MNLLRRTLSLFRRDGGNGAQSASSNLQPNRTPIVWVDLEMSGLDIKTERILEIAVAITDHKLENLIKGPNIIVHQEDDLIDGMDEWNTTHHGESGLTQAVRDSKISEKQAEEMVLDFVSKHVEKGLCPLAGNTIYMDKMFLMKCMPNFADYLNYRLIDVSSIKELSKRWLPSVAQSAPVKRGTHRAMDDILESIVELQHYKTHVFDKAL